MRKNSPLLAIVAVVTIPLTFAVISCAPAVGETVSLTGCLETGDEPGTFALDPVTESSERVDAEDVELVPAENVDLTAHVGHEVRITGEKMKAEGAHEEGYGAGEMTGAEGDELHVKVTDLEHISPTCTRSAGR